MGASPVRFALFAVALLLCLYLPHVALDMVRRTRTKRHSRPWGWVMGGAVSWGTSLWAAMLFTLLARHGTLELSHDPALLIASWLVTLGTAFGMFACRGDLANWRGTGISAGLAFGLSAFSALLLVSLQPVNPWACCGRSRAADAVRVAARRCRLLHHGQRGCCGCRQRTADAVCRGRRADGGSVALGGDDLVRYARAVGGLPSTHAARWPPWQRCCRCR